MPPMVTPSISTVKRLCWLKSPAVFLVVPLRTSRLNFTAIQRLLSVPPAGAVHCDPAAVVPLRASTPHTFRALPDRRPPPTFLAHPRGGHHLMVSPPRTPSVTSTALPSGRCGR